MVVITIIHVKNFYKLKILIFKEKHLTEDQRRIILKFRQLHLNQQQLERHELDKRKWAAAQTDHNGNPKRILLYPDAMTQYTTRSPKFASSSNFLESRVIGVEAYCGNTIKTNFIYRTDSLVGGGANLMVEVLRQVSYSFIF